MADTGKYPSRNDVVRLGSCCVLHVDWYNVYRLSGNNEKTTKTEQVAEGGARS